MKHDWEYGCGLDQRTLALPLQVSWGLWDYGKRWGIGVRILCFRFYLCRDMFGYRLER